MASIDTFALDEAGDPAGFPVVYHHGTPGCRLLPSWWHEPAAARGLRLIGFDRAGYADRAARPGRDVADVARDVAALADRLGLERLVTFGVSGGGPHTLATAALLPDRVAAVASVAGVGPYGAPGLDFMQDMGEANVEEFGLALQGAEALVPFLERESASLAGATAETVVQALDTLLSPPDRAVLDERVANAFLEEIREGVRTGVEGWRDDDLAYTEAWGFELDDIRVPTSTWQGGDDLMVPRHHGPWLADAIPGAELHVLDGEGHISLGLVKIGMVFDWLAERTD